MHACGIKFVGINVRGTCLVSENYEHFYPRKCPAILNASHSSYLQLTEATAQQNWAQLDLIH